MVDFSLPCVITRGYLSLLCVYWQYIRYHPKHQQHQHEKNKPSYKTWLAGFHAWRFVCSFLQKNMLCHWNFIGIVILHTSSSGWFSWNSLYNRLRQVRATWQSRSRVYYIGKTRKPSLIYHGCCWFMAVVSIRADVGCIASYHLRILMMTSIRKPESPG